MVVTTRTLAELQAQCREAGVAYEPTWGREQLMDALRAAIGTTDTALQVDPAKAIDLKSKIDWASEDPFKNVQSYLTPAWVAEPKLDGARMLMFLGTSGNTMHTGRRSVKTFSYIPRTDNFPHLRDAVIEEFAGTVIDGEIISPTKRLPMEKAGEWTNSLLNASVKLVTLAPEKSVRVQERCGRAQFWVFDILALKGADVTMHSYDTRRAYLEAVVSTLQELHPECEIRIVPQYEANAEVINTAITEGFEGVMLKRRTGAYQPGKRMQVWAKVKRFYTADAYVVDYTPGESGNTGMVGSLEVAVREADGSERRIGQVGNLTDELRAAITAEDGSLKQTIYGIVVEVCAQGLGKNGRMRHAHLVRIRPDKIAEDCLVDQLAGFAAV